MKDIEKISNLIKEKKIKYIFFDLDGTLYPATAGIEFQIIPSVQETAAKYLNVSKEEAVKMLRQYRQKYKVSYIGLKKHHNIDPKVFLNDVFKNIDISIIPIYENLRSSLHVLSQTIDLHLITNSNSGHADRVLRHLCVFNIFNKRVFSIEDMEYIRKPHDNAYLKMKERFGIGDFSEVLIFDDSYLNIEACHSFGMSTVLVSNKLAKKPLFWEMHKKIEHRPIKETTDYTYDLVSYIQSLNKLIKKP